MVASVDGAATAGGRSGGLGGPADRAVFTVLRSLADVILVGAATARTEHYRHVSAGQVWPQLRTGQRPAPAIAVITSSLDLDDCPFLSGPPPRDPEPIVITAAAAPPERLAGLAGKARVLIAGEKHVDVTEAISALGGLGYRQILTEGGPRLLGQLTEAGLVDELCLTISPVIAAGPAGRIATSPHEHSAPLRLEHVLTDDDFLLARYVRSAE